jgi:histidine triad (HIT) family protein
MTDECVFCKIVRGEIPCYKIYEDEEVLGFLDAFPSMKGQSIIIPKKHIAPWLFQADDETYCKLMLAAKKTIKAVDKAVNPIKTGLVVEGLELEHAHIKIFPFSERGFKDYTTTINLSKEEMQEIAERIRKSF